MGTRYFGVLGVSAGGLTVPNNKYSHIPPRAQTSVSQRITRYISAGHDTKSYEKYFGVPTK